MRRPTTHTIALTDHDHVKRRIRLHADGATLRSGKYVEGIVLNVQKRDDKERELDGYTTVMTPDEALQLSVRLQILVTEYLTHRGTL